VSAALLLGVLLGMRHALEADHLAAVATLTVRSRDARHAMLQGATWGLGHTVTLFLVCGIALLVETRVPLRLAHVLEAAVGVMLILLGADTLRRLWRERVHLHVHRHDDGIVHLHFHSHADDSAPHELNHRHTHPGGFPVRALYIGMMHGLAGSAALLLIAVGSAGSALKGLLYVALFGLGSIGGMAVLSLAVSLPLRSARNVTWLHNGLQTAVGCCSVAIGGLLLYENLRLTVT
jgi:hypothetical protein